MVVVKKGESKIGDAIRGKVQSPSLFGTAQFGAFKVAAGADTYGIYQVRTRGGKQIHVKEKLYVPRNPQTETQQNWRGIFRDAVLSWQNLSENEKEYYKEIAKSLNMSGYNFYLSEYLTENR